MDMRPSERAYKPGRAISWQFPLLHPGRMKSSADLTHPGSQTSGRAWGPSHWGGAPDGCDRVADADSRPPEHLNRARRAPTTSPAIAQALRAFYFLRPSCTGPWADTTKPHPYEHARLRNPCSTLHRHPFMCPDCAESGFTRRRSDSRPRRGT